MKKIVYVFDDINYRSGAQKAALYQIKCLLKKYDVYVLSLSQPIIGVDIPGKVLQTLSLWKMAEIYTKSFREVLCSSYSIISKLKRIFYALAVRLGKEEYFLESYLYSELLQCFEEFDVVIVVSEASKVRHLVGNLDTIKKIQWIHTDYALWSQYSEWTRAITKGDTLLYKNFDHIVVLSERSRAGMACKIPELQEKLVVIPNMVDISEILEKSLLPSRVNLETCAYRIVTVGRLDKEKNFDRILQVCKALQNDKIDFRWYLIGDGPQKNYIFGQIAKMGLREQVIMLGRIDNPYPIMKECDFFVLLSDYEGTPVTIDEAAVLGLPVIATPVGGIPEQLKRYHFGNLVRMDENLYRDFRDAMEKRESSKRMCVEMINEVILEQIESLFK